MSFPENFTPGDTYPARIGGGPSCEVILWAREGSKVIATWARRGGAGFDAKEGPKSSGWPVVIDTSRPMGDMSDPTFAAKTCFGSRSPRMVDDLTIVVSGRRSGVYVARDEKANGIQIMAEGRVDDARRLGLL